MATIAEKEKKVRKMREICIALSIVKENNGE